jgi:hypothetical protein
MSRLIVKELRYANGRLFCTAKLPLLGTDLDTDLLPWRPLLTCVLLLGLCGGVWYVGRWGGY